MLRRGDGEILCFEFLVFQAFHVKRRSLCSGLHILHGLEGGHHGQGNNGEERKSREGDDKR